MGLDCGVRAKTLSGGDHEIGVNAERVTKALGAMKLKAGSTPAGPALYFPLHYTASPEAALQGLTPGSVLRDTLLGCGPCGVTHYPEEVGNLSGYGTQGDGGV